MNTGNKKLATIFFSLVALLCVIGKCYSLSQISFDLDKFNSEITPAFKNIKMSTRVDFEPNGDTTVNDYLYYSAKFIAAPHLLLYKRKLDTVLSVTLKSGKTLKFPGYKIVYKAENEGTVVTLLTKEK